MTRRSLAAREPLLLGAPAPVLAAGGAGLALATALVEALLDREQIALWPFEVAALIALAAAGFVVVVRADPFRAPFLVRSHAAVLGLVLLAAVLDEVAQQGRNSPLHDDWGLVVVPVFLLVLATLRPPREVLLAGLLAVVVLGTTVWFTSPAPVPLREALPHVGVVVTQLLPPAAAATALARVTLRRLDRRAGPAVPPVGAEATLSVQQETIARLEEEAIPLLTAVAAARAVTGDQAERAGTIAAGLRAALVADLTRGWLAEAGFAVDDPDGYTERLTPAQRTALRTTVASLPLRDFERPGTASVRGQDRQASLTLTLPVAAPPRRSRVAPLVPLLRTAFPQADVRIDVDRVLVLVDFAIER